MKLSSLVFAFAVSASASTLAFDSGSTGADGVFAPVVDTTLSLPPDGVFNFQSMTIPSGVVVDFDKNAGNTPVTLLVAGDVIVDGQLNVAGQEQAGGPGGFNGGAGGLALGLGVSPGGVGGGPGGGTIGLGLDSRLRFCDSGGGSYGSTGATNCRGLATAVYGREELVPLIGGSGGGGMQGTETKLGVAGGGGGGAILIAASGSIVVNGSINANGGAPIACPGAGEGSGGAIRLVATSVAGEGAITAISNPTTSCASGGVGRIRIETEMLQRTSATQPAFTSDLPGPLFVPTFPTISISTIGGMSVPAIPTGMDDITLPPSTVNPVAVEFTTSGVPVGSVVTVRTLPLRGEAVVTTGTAVAGTEAAGTASADVAIPADSSVMTAFVEFLVDSQASTEFAPYADGQLVARVRAGFEPGVGQTTTFITHEGKEYTWPTAALN